MNEKPNIKDLKVDIKYDRKERVISLTQTTVTEELYPNHAIDALIEQIQGQIKGYKKAIKEYQGRLKTYKEMRIPIKKDRASDAVLFANQQKELEKKALKKAKKDAKNIKSKKVK
jgi:hypothetical protein